MEVQSSLVCPHCVHQETETMPTDACQYFYACKGCGVVLRPNDGDCCVVLLVRLSTVPADPGSTGRLLEKFAKEGMRLYRRAETSEQWRDAAMANLKRCITELRNRIAELSSV